MLLLIESHTPAAPSTLHTMATETTVTTPRAIESRNDVFITDHGSSRINRNRAVRVLPFDAAGFAAPLDAVVRAVLPPRPPPVRLLDAPVLAARWAPDAPVLPELLGAAGPRYWAWSFWAWSFWA